jgi:signal peptidase I
VDTDMGRRDRITETREKKSRSDLPSTRKHQKEAKRKARELISEVIRLVRKHQKKLETEAQWELGDAARRLKHLLTDADTDWGVLIPTMEKVDASLEKHLGFARKSHGREVFESIAIALLIALFIRTFLFEPFKIPTGSMIPTLRVGDHIFVSKFIYGVRVPYTGLRFFDWRTPTRGEVVVFEFPGPGKDHGKDFIKRIMAVEGDRIRLENNVFYVDGEATGPPRVLARSDQCKMPPDEQCRWQPRSAALGLSGNMLSTAPRRGCPCTFLEERSDSHVWVVQHVSPDVICRCVAPDDSLPQAVDNKADWPMYGAGYSGYRRGWGDGRSAEKWTRRNPSGLDEMVVPPGYVFVMGDNRDNSHDGRYWGLVPKNVIKGKALVIWAAWPNLWDRWFRQVHGQAG